MSDFESADSLSAKYDDDDDDEEYGLDDSDYDDAGMHVCPKCNGSGIWIDDIEPCDHCDGLGYEWWL